MPSKAGASVANALVRMRRDLRFTLIDRYRALLGSRYAAATAVVAGAVDLAVGVRRALRTAIVRRGAEPTGPQLLRAAVSADGLLSLVVTASETNEVKLGDHTLATIVDTGGDSVRLVAQLPDTAADGHDRTVTIGGTDIVVADHDVVPPAFAVHEGRLVLRGREAGTGRPHTLQIGVRTAVVSWPAHDGGQLTIGDVEISTRVVDSVGTAEVDLADLRGAHPALVGPARVPLALGAGSWAPDARPGTPPAVRVTPRAGHTVEIGYTADGRLEFRHVSSTAAAWTS